MSKDFLPVDADLHQKITDAVNTHFANKSGVDARDLVAVGVKIAADILAQYPGEQSRENAVKFALHMLAQKSGYNITVSLQPKAREH